MPGLMARILSRRADGAPPTAPDPADAPSTDQPTVVVPAHGEGRMAPSAQLIGAPEQATAVVPVAGAGGDPAPQQPTAVVPTVEGEAPVAEQPAAANDAGPTDAGPAEEATDRSARAEVDFRNRSRLRRRLRYLRRVREIGFRDLGGLVVDLDRFGRDRPDLVEMKLAGLKSIDAELRALEVALDDVRPFDELHEPGISACTHCGALHGSEARFCSACGIEVGAPPVSAVEAAAAPPADQPGEDAAAPGEEAAGEEAVAASAPVEAHAAEEQPPAEEPFAEEPAAEQPPAEEPPAEEPRGDPAAEEPPSDARSDETPETGGSEPQQPAA